MYKIQSEDQKLVSRAEDLSSMVEKTRKPRFLGFLNQREKQIIETHAKKLESKVVFFGGYPEAERTFAAFFYENPVDPNSFPIKPITVLFRKEEKLEHRDFLGALLHLQISRESIGDICVKEGEAVLFLSTIPAENIFFELKKVRNVGVRLEKGIPENFSFQKETEEHHLIVSSTRLDAIVAACIKKSRSQSQLLIQSGMIQVNHQICEDISRKLTGRELISIRKYGRFLLKEFEGTTRKGKVILLTQKYK